MICKIFLKGDDELDSESNFVVVDTDWTVADCISQVQVLQYVKGGRIVTKSSGLCDSLDVSLKLSAISELPPILYFVDYDKMSKAEIRQYDREVQDHMDHYGTASFLFGRFWFFVKLRELIQNVFSCFKTKEPKVAIHKRYYEEDDDSTDETRSPLI